MTAPASLEAAARAVAETCLCMDRDYVSTCPRSHARLMIRAGVCLSASTGRSLYYRMQGAGLIVTRQGKDYYDLPAIGTMLRKGAEACHAASLSGVCATVTSSRRDA